MITLNDFKNNNLKINWKVINIGCLGSILNALGLLPKQNNKQIKL